MAKQTPTPKIYVYLLGTLIFFGLYLTNLHSYLLFHSLAEIFSIVVAFGIFVIVWNSRQFLDNNYLLLVGIGYLFIGGLDLVHTLSYKGMGVFQGYGTNLPTQLWMAARYMESISLLIAPLLFRRKLKVNLIFLGYVLTTSILFLSIFYWKFFPACFIEGTGLTPFKKISEYIISLILLASIALLLKNRREFDRKILQWVVWSIIFTIASEVAFTFYTDAYGLANLIGHFFKIISFYLIYKALIETGFSKPYNLLFKNLKESEERFKDIFAESPVGIELYDSNGQLLEINKACLEIFGISDVMKVKGSKLFEDPNLSEGVKEKLKNGESIRYEASFDFEKAKDYKLYPTTKSGRIDLDVLITPLIFKQNETPSGYLVQVLNITERKRVEEKLRRSRDELEKRVRARTAELKSFVEALKIERQRFYNVLEMLPAYLVLLTPDYHIPFANRFFRERFGESHGRKCFEYLFGRSGPCEICETYTVLKTMAPHEWEWAGPDGRNYYVFDFPFTDTDGSTLILEMGIDVTERKHAEETLRESENRLRLLSSQLLTIQETERKRVAHELHDGIGQMLTAIKFKIENIFYEEKNGEFEKGKTSCETIIPLIKESVEEVRRIQMNLRPSILDDLGILSTIAWFTREFEKIYSTIHIEKQIDIEEKEVSDQLKTVIFRVMQEAMNNIAKHSRADLIRLSLERKEGKIELIIQDNGMGLDLEGILLKENDKRGLGLSSMRERTELSGGSFTIEAVKGKGTTIRASWPIA